MFGTTVEFNAANDDIIFSGSRPSKAECLQIGWDYYTANEAKQDAMLAEFGGVLVRRSLRVFGNYAKRTSQKEVAQYAEGLASEITVSNDTEVA